MTTESQHFEIEQRFLLSINPEQSAFLKTLSHKRIRQFYAHLGPHPDNIFRIRIVNNDRAEITRKDGTVGQKRKEDPALPFDLLLALHLYDRATYKIDKLRHEIDGWEIDVFSDRHEGLILAEYEKKRIDDPLPTFPRAAGTIVREVTDEISNYMLACMGQRSGTRRCKRIAFTGGPCSGKSTAIEYIAKHFPQVHCLKEVASSVMDIAKIYPYGGRDELEKSHNFQRTLAAVQIALEDGADVEAVSEGRTLNILDRGVGDGAAYVNGMRDFESIINMDRHAIYGRYDMIVYFEMPNEEVYHQHSKNNPHRYEKDYAAAKMRGNNVMDAWAAHPHFVVIPDAPSWDEKLANVLAVIKPLL